jgi:CRP-like cAMP-binding protein
MKRWFKGREPTAQSEAEMVEDLIVLERYEEAEQKLRHRLKIVPKDLHAHLKLADVYTAARRLDDAVLEYVFVAEAYAGDGFFDKGLALLARAQKLRPLDEGLRLKIGALERAKRLEHSRVMAVEGLRSAGGAQRRAAMELQHLWHNLTGCSLLDRLVSEQVKLLFSALEVLHVNSGQLLVERGSRVAQLFLIARGAVEARVTTGGEETALRSFATGDIVGDSVLLEHIPWPATYRTLEESTLLRLDRAGLAKALTGNPDPRGFLNALREQRNDRRILGAVRRLEAMG